MKRIGRRKVLVGGAALLAGGAVVADPVRSFVAGLLRGIKGSAKLREEGAQDPARNYLKIHLYGSPARYMFDHPLRPSDRDGFCPDPHVINRLNPFDNALPHLTSGHYADTKVKGINMPYIWNFDVPARGGGSRPLADLISNMLIIRGGDMGSDGHPLNSAKLVAPIHGGTSITGLVAERSPRPIPAINLGRSPASRAFRSPRGVSVVDIPPEAGDYGQYLLQAFADSRGVDAAVSDALEELEGFARGRTPGAAVVASERRNADRMIRRGVADLAGGYPALLAKYTDLVERSYASARIPGVTDLPVHGIKLPFTMPGDVAVIAAVGRHQIEGHIIMGDGYVEAMMRAKMLSLASEFAIAEFALLEGLSSSVLVAPPNEMGNLLSFVAFEQAVPLSAVRRVYDATAGHTTFTSTVRPAFHRDLIAFDAHNVGSLPHLISCSIYYRALGACMLEIIDQLRAKKEGGGSLFDETIVQLSTEFERLPTLDGSDSAHNHRAHMTSIYSGIVQQPTVLGNIWVGSAKSRGTIGFGAPVEGLKNKVVNFNNMSSTLSQLLRVPPIVPRAQPLLEVDGSKIELLIETARNVEGDHAAGKT